MAERELVTPDAEALKAAGIQIWHNFLPDDLLEEVAQRILHMPDRKVIHEIDHGAPASAFPHPIDKIETLIRELYEGVDNNVAIEKRYDIGETSGAYEAHFDPLKFQAAGIFLLSTSSEAVLSTFSLSFVRPQLQILCRPNTLVAMPGDTGHIISEPNPDLGPRGLVFLGHSCPHLENLPQDQVLY